MSSLFEVGRLCVKTQGRDAANYCVVVEVLDEKYVLVDGNTRRKKVNMTHLEPLNKVLSVKKGAAYKDVVAALEKENIAIKKKGEKKTPKPQQKKVVETKKETKTTKKSTKKEK